MNSEYKGIEMNHRRHFLRGCMKFLTGCEGGDTIICKDLPPMKVKNVMTQVGFNRRWESNELFLPGFICTSKESASVTLLSDNMLVVEVSPCF